MLHELWEKILINLNQTLSGPGYQTFVSSSIPKSFEDNILTITVGNRFSMDWIKEKCEQSVRDTLQQNGFYPVIVMYDIDSTPVTNESSQMDLLEVTTPPPVITNPNGMFNPKYNFDNFIVGHNNRFAHAASEAVSKAPAKAYNPLFIYGSVGLGKTHLLHAIGNEIQKKHPKLKLFMVSSEKFTNELINSIKDKKVENFRSKYRNVDVLLVDDIQFLSGKEQTQEEFFHTFNELHSNNKQIILTSDRPPKEIPTLEIRLRTRFEWGLIADIQPPEFETRIAILRKKIELYNIRISDEILHFIATQIPTNVREMEGCLTKISAYASLLNTEITLSIASNVIRDMIGIKNDKPLTITHIKRKVCDYFNVSNVDLCSKGRTRELTYARQIAMYLARELTNVSLPKIGENFGDRDHSTVMHACDKVKTLLVNDPETKSIINLLISNIKNDE
ncbi:chromosomal replication initiator protein DnaA [bacterium]|nr:chromosomal replication initiator protein DnaA [bacterium]